MLLVYWFRQQIEIVGGNVGIIQDTLLIHDLAESYAWVGDKTPHDAEYWSADHSKKEEAVIKKILSHNNTLIELWLDYEEERTPEGKLAMEFDKLQAIAQARHYENTHNIPWLTDEFFTYSVTKKKQIQTDFLLQYAISLHNNTFTSSSISTTPPQIEPQRHVIRN